MKRKSSDNIGDDDSSMKRKSSDTIVPKYGTREYWEARYKSHLNPGVGVDDTSTSTNAGHEWYFTYDELKPLIMPLILGDLNNEVAESDYDECSDAESWVEEEEEEDSDTEGKAKNDSTNDNTQEDIEEDIEEQELPDIDTTNLKPKRVLEIGCGDVPIATSLVSDLLSMQQSENGSNANLIDEVTCIDYSEVVIETLIKQQKKLQQEQQDSSGKKGTTQRLQPTFQTLDARSLPFESNTYDLILEKGTMDAMLSDEVDGIPNCIQIVEEMARVTSEGGAILIVSHLNANEDKGMGWLEDIVFSGLKDEFLERRKQKRKETKSTKDAATKDSDDDDDEKEYVWSVEVHGGEGKYLDANGEEIEDPTDDDTPTYGACVYIIKKKSVPASIARDLFGKKKKETTEDGDANSDDEKVELMEMPPVKLEFVTY